MRPSELIRRAGRPLWWRTYMRWIHPLADPLAARWGLPARMIRWPLPRQAPYRRARLHVGRGVALGDVLMSTPALREVKRRNPACHVTFYTDYPAVVEGLPYIDRVRPAAEAPPETIRMAYENSVHPRRRIARIVGDRLGVDVREVRPECIVDRELVRRFRRDWCDRPRPLVIANRRAAAYSPNEDWPDELWDELVDRLASRGTVIEVGASPPWAATGHGGSYIDLRGRTSLPDLAAAIAAADLHVGPITGTVHIAAAMGTPSVVIYGGYEHPSCSGYPGNINLYSPVDYAPCWLRDPCPFGAKCLHSITPDQVEAALDRLWSARIPESARRPIPAPAGALLPDEAVIDPARSGSSE